MKPKTPPIIVKPPASKNPKTLEMSGSILPTLVKTVSEAKVASETRTVSQPTNIKYDKNPGRRFPLTPNAARDSVMVGAFARFPARDEIATNAKLPIVPIRAAAVACQNEIPNPKKNEPYESARNETFAAAHGQNNDLAEPMRSDSLIKLIPFNSILLEMFGIRHIN